MGTDIQSIQMTYQSLMRGNYAMLDNLKLGKQYAIAQYKPRENGKTLMYSQGDTVPSPTMGRCNDYRKHMISTAIKAVLFSWKRVEYTQACGSARGC